MRKVFKFKQFWKGYSQQSMTKRTFKSLSLNCAPFLFYKKKQRSFREIFRFRLQEKWKIMSTWKQPTGANSICLYHCVEFPRLRRGKTFSMKFADFQNKAFIWMLPTLADTYTSTCFFCQYSNFYRPHSSHCILRNVEVRAIYLFCCKFNVVKCREC